MIAAHPTAPVAPSAAESTARDERHVAERTDAPVAASVAAPSAGR